MRGIVMRSKEKMSDSEKLMEIRRFLYYAAYHEENELRTAENNFIKSVPRDDINGLLELYKAKCHKEAFDKFFADVSKILYEW